MKKKLFLTYLVIMFILILVSFYGFGIKGYNFIKNQNKEYYELEAKILADDLENENIEFEEFTKQKVKKYNIRVTIIDLNGNVLTDSDRNVNELENHLYRDEIRKALKLGYGSAIRYSETMGIDYVYSAVLVESKNCILRVSVPLNNVQNLEKNLIMTMIETIILGLIISFVFASIFSKKFSEPIIEIAKASEKIANGDYNAKIYTSDKENLGKLVYSFNEMTKKLNINRDILMNKNIELETVLKSMSSGVVAVDRYDNILFHNKKFNEIIDIKEKEDLINKNLFHIVRNEIFYNTIEEVKKENKKIVLEDNFLEKFIKITGVVLTRNDNANIGVLLVIEDISELKKLENIRSDFTSNVTHELKTPLTSIKGFVDTLKDGAIKNEKVAMHFLDIIDVETERLYSLIQDILMLSEIENKKEENKIYCDVNIILDDVINLLTPKFKENIEMNFDIEDNIPKIFSNASRLKEVFINLIDNAIKYTENGSILIYCKCENEKLVFKVKDTGIGIAKEHIPRLFERFYRVDKGRSRKQGGTGLGLSIVKHIVELYGGKVEVISEISVGTEFKVEIPY